MALLLLTAAEPDSARGPAGPAKAEAHLHGQRALLLAILFVAAVLRFHHLDYATAFVDEASFVQVGRAVLERPLETPYSEPLKFMFGWYLWPVLSAVGDQIGGIAGVRAVTAVLGTITVLAVYLFARRLFGAEVGLAAAGLFAVLGPSVHVSRFGSYDAAALCFLSVGLWLYARAWHEERLGIWLLAGLSLFLAFLAKYFVALYFPLLVIVSLRKGKKVLFGFSLPLAVLCAGFLAVFWNDMAALIAFGQRHVELTAPREQLWGIYVANRLEFWVLLLLGLCAGLRAAPGRWTVPLLWLGAAVMVGFQAWSRADYNTWKHVNYSLLYVVPLAVAGVWRLSRWLRLRARGYAFAAAVAALGVALGWNGKAWRPDEFYFWPDVRPILTVLEPRLTPQARVLADDLVFQFYYFEKSLRATQTTSPYFFRYGGQTGGAAYAAAVKDGLFDFIVFDGWAAPKSRELRAVVRPALSANYAPLLNQPVRQMDGRLEVYARTQASRLEPLLEALRPALSRGAWVLAQNWDARYSLEPWTTSGGVVDSERFEFGEERGVAACATALRHGLFDYVVLDEGSPYAAELPATIRADLSAEYLLKLRMADAAGANVELYERKPAEAGRPRIEIRVPQSGAVVKAQGIESQLEGAVEGAAPGWRVQVEIYTNRWYPQGEPVVLAGSGTFRQTIWLGGPCRHLIRARLLDERGATVAAAASYGVKRAREDDSAPECRE
jgi:4-amino-4-deoxy-L-arabinose transferase-like glycosyltransferase